MTAALDAAVAGAMRELEADIADLERAARLAEYLLSEESVSRQTGDIITAISFNPAMFELVSFMMIETAGRASRLSERYQAAYRGQGSQ